MVARSSATISTWPPWARSTTVTGVDRSNSYMRGSLLGETNSGLEVAGHALAAAAGGGWAGRTGEGRGHRADQPRVDRDALGGGHLLDVGLERFGHPQGEPGEVAHVGGRR